ncbi:hypothetical protein K7X08_023831 [Anisodus acutangulus]|uniref:Plastid lipid-associated protein/fibrillin conserved domain-containing protein n=1 Tax=Anisodus acutangulus TaxID=402998 RepID=A0A9Q1QVV9_9SOLA|nr:hypothetical protein K7X08_023831 [Anisodus acutangulus]
MLLLSHQPPRGLAIQNPHNITISPLNKKWRTNVSFFPAFFNKTKHPTPIKQELLEAIAPLDRGTEATPQDQEIIDQVTADLTPLNARKVVVKFDYFKIAGLIPIKAPGRARGELEITYLDEELRVSRGDLGNLFILKMVDPYYKVPT